MMKIKLCTLAVLAASLLSGTVLAADAPAVKKPLVKMSCEDFLGLDDTFRPKAVYWAVAYGHSGKPEAADIDVDGIETIVPVVAEECQKTPKESFWKKVKSVFKKLAKGL